MLPMQGQEKHFQPARNQKDTKSVEQSSSPSSQLIVVQGQHPADNDALTKEHTESYFSRLFSPENLPNIGLFFAGIGGIAVGIYTLRDIRRQTRFLGEYVTATKEGVAATRESAIAAQENAIAAKLAAEASVKSVAALISKERARIRVEPKKFKIAKRDEDGFTFQRVEYSVEVIGTTPAFIIDSGAMAHVSESEKPLSTIVNPPMGLPKILRPGVLERNGFLFPHWNASEEILNAMGAVHTSFHYIWKYSENGYTDMEGQRSGYWIKCGKPEGNAETNLDTTERNDQEK
jgi:hypothetical protein